ACQISIRKSPGLNRVQSGLAGMQTVKPDPGDGYLERMVKYVPAEIVAFSMVINAILAQRRARAQGTMSGCTQPRSNLRTLAWNTTRPFRQAHTRPPTGSDSEFRKRVADLDWELPIMQARGRVEDQPTPLITCPDNPNWRKLSYVGV